MTPYKRTEITIETQRTVTIRRRRSMRAWCPQCGCDVDMVGLAEAETLTGMSGAVLHDYAKGRGWHVVQGHDGHSVVCLESYLNRK